MRTASLCLPNTTVFRLSLLTFRREPSHGPYLLTNTVSRADRLTVVSNVLHGQRVDLPCQLPFIGQLRRLRHRCPHSLLPPSGNNDLSLQSQQQTTRNSSLKSFRSNHFPSLDILRLFRYSD